MPLATHGGIHGPPVQGPVEVRHALPAVGGADSQPLQKCLLLVCCQRRAQLIGRDQGILLSLPPLCGPGRNLPCQAVVHCGAQGVYIRPGALAAAGVLLSGGKAMLEGHGLGGLPLDIPGAAKIHQLDRTAFQHHQVVRADVPVDDPGSVHGLHGPQHRLQQLQHPPCRDNTLSRNQILQGFPLQELHDDVGGVVLREVVQHPHNLRDAVQGRHGPGLLEKPLPPLLVGSPSLRGVAGHIQGQGGFPADQEGGEILLDGDLSLQAGVQP